MLRIPANSAASHSAFDAKSGWLKRSLLALNLEILERPKWDETEIEERAGRLGDHAVTIWPALPEIHPTVVAPQTQLQLQAD